jgi:hypothetical protein
VPELVEVAHQGLIAAGVDSGEADTMMGVIAERAERGITGARWQLRTLEALEPRLDREDALVAMVNRYLEHAATGEPVHRWPLPR